MPSLPPLTSHSAWKADRAKLAAQIEAASEDDDIAAIGEDLDRLDRDIIETPAQCLIGLRVQLEVVHNMLVPGGEPHIALGKILDQLETPWPDKLSLT